MAQIVRTDTAIIVKPGPVERLLAGSFREVTVPVAALERVEVVDDIWTRVRGVRPPMTWMKDRFTVGTRRGLFGKDFTAVYGLGRGICVEFHRGEAWSRFVVTVPYPEDTAALLRG